MTRPLTPPSTAEKSCGQEQSLEEDGNYLDRDSKNLGFEQEFEERFQADLARKLG